MFSLRQAAVRVLSSRASSVVARPRTFTSAAYVTSKPSPIVSSIQLQRRWASNETSQHKQDQEQDQVPISELQPTPQAEVENAIHEDNAAAEAASGLAQAANADNGADSFRDNFNRRGDSGSGSARPLREPATPKSTVYVGNLFFDVTEHDLAKEFGKFGNIESARLIRDARGLSKGFGYIKYGSVQEATSAINEMNQQLYEGRRILVAFSQTDERPRRREDKPANPPSKTLFIGNMSYEMTDRDLNAMFKGIRNVIDVRVAIDRRTGQPRGFAHADFVDVKSAMDAAQVLAEKESYGRKLRIDYSQGASNAPRNTPR